MACCRRRSGTCWGWCSRRPSCCSRTLRWFTCCRSRIFWAPPARSRSAMGGWSRCICSRPWFILRFPVSRHSVSGAFNPASPLSISETFMIEISHVDKWFGLKDHARKYPAELSGGQQQRVAIARALAMDPFAMLFDEPTSALDPEMISEVLDVMVDLAREGMTMMVVPHEMGFASKVAHRVIFMDQGEIVADALKTDFFGSPRSDLAQKFQSKILSHSDAPPSLRATWSRECAPADRLREAIHSSVVLWIASSPCSSQ